MRDIEKNFGLRTVAGEKIKTFYSVWKWIRHFREIMTSYRIEFCPFIIILSSCLEQSSFPVAKRIEGARCFVWYSLDPTFMQGQGKEGVSSSFLWHPRLPVSLPPPFPPFPRVCPKKFPPSPHTLFSLYRMSSFPDPRPKGEARDSLLTAGMMTSSPSQIEGENLAIFL